MMTKCSWKKTVSCLRLTERVTSKMSMGGQTDRQTDTTQFCSILGSIILETMITLH